MFIFLASHFYYPLLYYNNYRIFFFFFCTSLVGEKGFHITASDQRGDYRMLYSVFTLTRLNLDGLNCTDQNFFSKYTLSLMEVILILRHILALLVHIHI